MKFVFFILSLLIAGNAYSQCNSNTFRFVLGGNGTESAQSIIEIAGGDMIIGGETTSFGSGAEDLFLTRMTPDGQIVWSRTYGGTAREQFRRMSLALDGSILLAAQTMSYGNTKGEAIAMKIDLNGNVLWSSKFSLSNESSLGLDILSTTDNGYVLCGLEYASDFTSDWMIVKLDDSGNILWTKRLALDSDETAYSAVQKGDTLIVSGMGRHPSHYADIYLKLSLADGTLYSTQAYSIDGRGSFSTKILHSPTGEYRVSTHIINDASYNQKQDGMITFDENMVPKQAFKINVTSPYNNSWFSGFVQTADNGYLIATSPLTGVAGYLYKFDQNHNLVYTKRFSSTAQMWTGYTIEATDGTIWVVGSENNHALVMKLTPTAMFDNCPNEDVSRTTVPVTYNNFSYSWNSVSNYSFANIHFSPAAGNFTFTIDSLCKATPVCGDISIQGRDTVCSLTDSVTYIARTGSCAIGTVNWTLPAGVTSRIVNDSTIKVVFNAAGAHQIIIENQLACETQRDTLLVRVFPTPALELGADSTICDGGAVTLNAGTGFRTYRWQDGSTSQTFTVNALTGKYYVQTTDFCNNVFSDTINLAYRFATDFSVYPIDTTLCVPSQINFLATGGDTYTWTPATYLNATNISNPVGTPTISTVYSVLISDTVCHRTEQLTSTINIATPLSLELGADTTICDGAAVTLDAGAGFRTYRWQDGSTSQTLTVNGVSGKYYVEAVDFCNNILSDTIQLNYRSIADFSVYPTDTSLCAPSQINFLATGGDTYTWTPATYLNATNISNPVGTPMLSTVYSVLISDTVCHRTEQLTATIKIATVLSLELGADTTICDGGAVTLDAGAGFRTYRWQDGSTSQTFMVNGVSGEYYVEAIDSCNNVFTDTIHLNYRSAADFSVSPTDTTVCANSPVNLLATGGDTYAWTPATYLNAVNISNPVAMPTLSTVYSVLISDTVCNRTEQLTVNINIDPVPSLELGADSTICDGAVITLDAGAGFRTYVWQDGSTSRTYTVNAQSGEYYVRAIDNCNNVLSDTIRLDYRSATAFTVSPIDTSYCEPSQINFLATGGDTYRWTPNTYLDADNISNPVGTPTSSIAYSVLISDTVCHRTEQRTVNITIDPVPDVTVSKSNDITCAVAAAQLVATGGSRYQWSPAATLSNDTIANPVARPGATTTYTVRVYNTLGCYKDDSVKVDFYKTGSSEILAPTGFTPNGDGKNDVFRLKSSGQNTIKVFSVFNRWGELVFTTTDASKGWDGRFKGKLQEAGAYYWFVQASNPCDGEFMRKGHVILIK